MNRIRKVRARAIKSQKNFCIYCGRPMVASEQLLEAFSLKYKLSREQARSLLATAEHLHPRSEGGNCAKNNIAAAHALCNHKRHQQKEILPPQKYRNFVQKLCAKGDWHDPVILKLPSQLPPIRT